MLDERDKAIEEAMANADYKRYIGEHIEGFLETLHEHGYDIVKKEPTDGE